MPVESVINIRKFEAKDRQDIRRIVHDAAFMGEPASVFFDAREAMSDALTLYFTDYEPESCFVVDAGNKVVGCLIGTKDKIAAEKLISAKIGFRLLWDALISGAFLKKKNIVFIYNALLSMIKGEFRMPDFAKEYPAILHINIDKEYRGLGIGTRLIEAYLSYLRQKGVFAVHLATMSEKATQFFTKQGFVLLFSGKRSYFRHIIGKDVPLYVYGKKL